jgi:hypothetical protein
VPPARFGRLKWGVTIAAGVFKNLARRTRMSPALTFCLVGGLVSFPGHAWGIWGRGLLEKFALTFGFFEFIIYRSGILVAPSIVDRLRHTA